MSNTNHVEKKRLRDAFEQTLRRHEISGKVDWKACASVRTSSDDIAATVASSMVRFNSSGPELKMRVMRVMARYKRYACNTGCKTTSFGVSLAMILTTTLFPTTAVSTFPWTRPRWGRALREPIQNEAKINMLGVDFTKWQTNYKYFHSLIIPGKPSRSVQTPPCQTRQRTASPPPSVPRSPSPLRRPPAPL